MKKTRIIVLLIFAVCFCALSSIAQAKGTEFDFYYQCIEKVVQINNPEPKGWWQKSKALAKDGVNLVKRTWESQVTRKVAPGEGKKLWYSEDNHNIAYEVRRVKVTSVEHLLELMGAKSESELADGQKAMLAVYKHSQSQAVKDRLKYSKRDKLNVILSDTSGFECAADYEHVSADFWPYSNGPVIQMSSGRYNYPGSEESAQSTFVHEFSHSIDSTIKEFINPYGKDGSHFVSELTRPRSAFVEGWAEFNEMLDSPLKERYIKNSILRVKIEDKKEAGEYTDVDPKDLTAAQLLSVEGINATILHRIATEVDNGREKIFNSFMATKWKVFRDLKTLTLDLARKNPEDIAKIGLIVDEMTLGKLSDKELISIIGKSAAAMEFIKNRGTPAATETEEKVVKPKATAPAKGVEIKVNTDGNNPFSVK